MEQKQLEVLCKSLSIEEKVGQLIQLAPFFFNPKTMGEITGPMGEVGVSEQDIRNAGSVLGISGAKEMIEIQETYLAKNEKNIPLVIMADIIHGYRTIFPIPLAMGSSWDMELAEESARVAAREASAGGVHVTFSPMVDLVRDPRWGRVMESTGEDKFLNALFAKAFVKGYQGDDLKDQTRVAACVKHFAAYGGAEAGRDYNTVDMSERMLREQYLPAYKAALDAGAKMVMTSFNTVDMVPASGNEWLMRNVLRDEWGFDGVVISDWGAVKELIPHGCAADEKEAAEKAMKAGVDIEMMTGCYAKYLKKLIEEGKVSETLLDESVLRILELKNELGLFEDPYRGASEALEQEIVLCEEHRTIARIAAQKSMVLLENKNKVLPFSKAVKKVAVIGPLANSGEILGGWSWQGKFEETITVVEGIKNQLPDAVVEWCAAGTIKTMSDEELDQAIALAKQADIVILALGEDHNDSGEGASMTQITLPGRQNELAAAIANANPRCAAVLFNGRPLDIKELTMHVPAILEAWFPGTEGGNAVADLLFGDVEPTGRLTMSFPYNVGQVPVYYNCYNTGRPKPSEDSTERYVSHFVDAPNIPFYGFGYGLGYTTFEYSNLELSSTIVNEQEPIYAEITITNTGERRGSELVQCYLHDVSGSVVRPIRELKAFKRVECAPGEHTIVRFEIDAKMLCFETLRNGFASEAGKYVLMIGPNAYDVQSTTFEFVK